MTPVVPGDVSGRITAIRATPNHKLLIRCACGTEKEISVYNFPKTHSCGCVFHEQKTNLSHGMSRTPEHIVWLAAKGRCFNPLNHAFASYGGRGITMCAEWADNFQCFLRDMGIRPPRGTLDRIDNDGPYSPDNCRWATPKQQANNRRSSRVITLGTVSLTVAEWASRLNVPYMIITQRLNKLGWSPEKALTTPIRDWGPGRCRAPEHRNEVA